MNESPRPTKAGRGGVRCGMMLPKQDDFTFVRELGYNNAWDRKRGDSFGSGL
jgi:hypothetical protein